MGLGSYSGVPNRALSAGEELGVDPFPWVARTPSLRPILLLAGRDSRAIHPSQPRLYGPEMGKAGRMRRPRPMPHVAVASMAGISSGLQAATNRLRPLGLQRQIAAGDVLMDELEKLRCLHPLPLLGQQPE